MIFELILEPIFESILESVIASQVVPVEYSNQIVGFLHFYDLSVFKMRKKGNNLSSTESTGNQLSAVINHHQLGVWRFFLFPPKCSTQANCVVLNCEL